MSSAPKPPDGSNLLAPPERSKRPIQGGPAILTGNASADGTGDAPGGAGRTRLYLLLLWLYVAVLAVGTVGELLDIRWILDLPIY